MGGLWVTVRVVRGMARERGRVKAMMPGVW